MKIGINQWSLVMAVASVMVIPTVIFFFAQRTFIRGITLMGMKG